MGAVVPWSGNSMEKRLDPFNKYRKKLFDKPETPDVLATTDKSVGRSAEVAASRKRNKTSLLGG